MEKGYETTDKAVSKGSGRRAIERGSPKVAMGNYMSVLFCLGMQDDMAQVAAADLQGRDIQDARLLRGSRQGGTR